MWKNHQKPFTLLSHQENFQDAHTIFTPLAPIPTSKLRFSGPSVLVVSAHEGTSQHEAHRQPHTRLCTQIICSVLATQTPHKKESPLAPTCSAGTNPRNSTSHPVWEECKLHLLSHFRGVWSPGGQEQGQSVAAQERGVIFMEHLPLGERARRDRDVGACAAWA